MLQIIRGFLQESPVLQYVRTVPKINATNNLLRYGFILLQSVSLLLY